MASTQDTEPMAERVDPELAPNASLEWSFYVGYMMSGVNDQLIGLSWITAAIDLV